MTKSIEDQLSYDPETGVLTWLTSRGKRKVGSRAGALMNKGYRRIMVNGKRYLEHRLAYYLMTGEWPELEIDHKNRIRSDNRWTNLRTATDQQNAWNAEAYGESGVRGVHKHAGKWQVTDAYGKYACVTDDLEFAKELAYSSRQERYGEFFHGG